MLQKTHERILLNSIIGYEDTESTRLSQPFLAAKLSSFGITTVDNHYYSNGLIGQAKAPGYAFELLEMLNQPLNADARQVLSILELIECDHPVSIEDIVSKAMAIKRFRQLLVVMQIGIDCYRAAMSNFRNKHHFEQILLPSIGKYLQVKECQSKHA